VLSIAIFLLKPSFIAMSYTVSRRTVLLSLASLVTACGGRGGSATPPAGGITVTPGDGQVVISWEMTSGVEYWLPYAPQAAFSSPDFTTTSGLRWGTKVTSPYVLTGLTNDQIYTFGLNGRYGTGKGGGLTPAVTAIPSLAGRVWNVGGSMFGAGDMRGIAWGMATDGTSYYLAVGQSGALYKSSNDVTSAGLNWTSIPTGGIASNLNAAIYTQSKFIVVGDGGTIASSADLMTWSVGTSINAQKLNAIAGNGSRVVAVGDSGTIEYSADGITWLPSTVPSNMNANLYGVSYLSSGAWLAVGAGGTLLSSPDGVTWTALTSGVTTDLRAVAYRAASTVTTTLPVAATVTTAASFVVVGAGGVVLSSTDGVTWISQPSSVTADLLSVTSLPHQFLAVGVGGAVVTSTDGLSWTSRSSGVSSSLNGLTNSRGQYVAVGAAGANLYSR
jgi:hypothetical protein